jgi:IS4 transposase
LADVAISTAFGAVSLQSLRVWIAELSHSAARQQRFSALRGSLFVPSFGLKAEERKHSRNPDMG